MELIFKLFPFDATVICPNANCREKVHGVVLIYGIILLLTAISCFNGATTEYRANLVRPPKRSSSPHVHLDHVFLLVYVSTLTFFCLCLLEV